MLAAGLTNKGWVSVQLAYYWLKLEGPYDQATRLGTMDTIVHDAMETLEPFGGTLAGQEEVARRFTEAETAKAEARIQEVLGNPTGEGDGPAEAGDDTDSSA